ncbi:hypothetical protein ACWGPQ_18305 [Saccharomonospora azurea]|uniref:hypothetical protein n=1 Tax=Saccharomonospora azurea TaxID=40988 RepID=UPI00056BF0BE|nr:hypothetical protein [Saccharomonospora azurea]
MAEAWYNALANEAANGVSATEAVGAVLGGPAGAAMAGASAAARMAAAAGGGGSWSFDPEEIDAVIKEWKALLDELESDRDPLRSLQMSTYAPSPDQPSTEFSRGVSEGLVSLDSSLRSMILYVRQFIEKLESAKKGISDSDEAAESTFGTGRTVEV